MKCEWKKDVNPAIISKSIEDFLKNFGFKTKLTKTRNSNFYEVSGVLRTPEGDRRIIRVVLNKTADGLTVELKYGDPFHLNLKLGSLISLFGGGALLLKAYKSVEYYQKLEEKFWVYVQKVISET